MYTQEALDEGKIRSWILSGTLRVRAWGAQFRKMDEQNDDAMVIDDSLDL